MLLSRRLSKIGSLTKEIADFVVLNGYEEMPERVLAVAKKAILDGLGCTLAGSVEPVGRVITEYVRKMQNIQTLGP